MSNARIKIIEAIAAPLGFFVLALLIVESFLAIVLVGADLENNDKILGMWLGVGLFIMVTIAVFVLVWFKPQNLTFDKAAHLIDRGKAVYGTEKSPINNIDTLSPTRAEKNE